LRVIGKGNKERIVPIGIPAIRALENWISHGRPQLSKDFKETAVFIGSRGKRID